MSLCPCGSEIEYNDCCEPLISGEKKAESPGELMRSRYSAYVNIEIDYLKESTFPDQRGNFDPVQTRQWAESSDWKSLEILSTDKGGEDDTVGLVEFIATFEQNGQKQQHHEKAEFKKCDDKWYFYDGNPVSGQTYVRKTTKIGRNEPCPCGSGKKFKKCCANKYD